MTEPKNSTDWLKWWQNAVEDSLKTNSDFLNQAWQQYMALFKTDASKTSASTGQDWTSFLRNYAEYNAQLADKYMKAYEDWVKDVLNTSQKQEPAPAPAPPPPSSERSAAPPLELQLSGTPGQKISASFNLNNDGVHKQSGLFFKSAFFSYETGEPVDLELKINPPAVGILPGQSQQIDLHLALPRTVKPGQYRSQLSIQGFEDASFVLLLEVKEKPKRRTKSTKSK
jgi:hypothetical protein